MKSSHFLIGSLLLFFLILGLVLFFQSRITISAELLHSPLVDPFLSCENLSGGELPVPVGEASYPLFRLDTYNPYPFPIRNDEWFGKRLVLIFCARENDTPILAARVVEVVLEDIPPGRASRVIHLDEERRDEDVRIWIGDALIYRHEGRGRGFYALPLPRSVCNATRDVRLVWYDVLQTHTPADVCMNDALALAILRADS